MLTQAQIIKKYGEAGNEKNLVSITLPYKMRLAWDVKTTVKTMRCHKLIASNLNKVFEELLENYTYPTLVELGIDLFGGCYNFRLQRGGSKLSTHSWGIAIDLDPVRNTLRETSKTARFARPEYKKMIDIFYKNGFLSYGVERNNDWMHFEISN